MQYCVYLRKRYLMKANSQMYLCIFMNIIALSRLQFTKTTNHFNTSIIFLVYEIPDI